jgi:hypothetical protein
LLVEVTGYPLSQALGLSDVDDRIICIEELVNAR